MTGDKALLLFPSDYYSAKAVDPDMLGEYDAALDTGIFDVILFSYEKWFCQGALSLDKKPEKPGANAVRANAIYRGWMMKPAQYAEFYARLSEKGVDLLTSPKQYELFHIFPNIYPQLAEDTVKMLVWNLKDLT